MSQEFPKSYRLLKRREFVTVYSSGTPYRNAGFHLFVKKQENSDGPTRLGMTVTRSVGCSVVRNRLRRWTRETVRQNYGRLRPGFDIILNYHRSLAAKPRQEFDQLLENILKKADLLREPFCPAASACRESAPDLG